MKVCMKQECIIEVHHVEKIRLINFHYNLVNVYRDQTVDMNTVKSGG